VFPYIFSPKVAGVPVLSRKISVSITGNPDLGL